MFLCMVNCNIINNIFLYNLETDFIRNNLNLILNITILWNSFMIASVAITLGLSGLLKHNYYIRKYIVTGKMLFWTEYCVFVICSLWLTQMFAVFTPYDFTMFKFVFVGVIINQIQLIFHLLGANNLFELESKSTR